MQKHDFKVSQQNIIFHLQLMIILQGWPDSEIAKSYSWGWTNYLCNHFRFTFFHGFIIHVLYLKFWLHKFYIQNAAECTIVCPSEKKYPPPSTAFSLSRVGMYMYVILLYQKYKKNIRENYDLNWYLQLNSSQRLF
jgi:hypothetical protein